MLQSHQIDDLIQLVAALDREALVGQFHCYRANFPVDFTDEFLATMPLDRLRHIFVALCIQHRRMPDFDMSTAA